MSMIKSLKDRIKESSGNAVATFFILAIPLIIIVMSFAVDTAKTNSARTVFTSVTQESADVAVKHLNNQGYIDNKSLEKFYQYYAKSSNNVDVVSCTPSGTGAQKVMEISLESSVTSTTTSFTLWKGDNNVDRLSSMKNLGSSKFDRIKVTSYNYSKNFFSIFGGSDCQQHKSTVTSVKFADSEDIAYAYSQKG